MSVLISAFVVLIVSLILLTAVGVIAQFRLLSSFRDVLRALESFDSALRDRIDQERGELEARSSHRHQEIVAVLKDQLRTMKSG